MENPDCDVFMKAFCYLSGPKQHSSDYNVNDKDNMTYVWNWCVNI